MDISVKPVGLPIASPVAATGDTPRGAVPTQLPIDQAVAQPEATTRSRHQPASIPQPVTNKVVIDKAAATIVFQTVDDLTAQVVGQYPAEGMLRRRAYVRALDQAKSDAAVLPTDRKA